jgi:thioredoxin 2
MMKAANAKPRRKGDSMTSTESTMPETTLIRCPNCGATNRVPLARLTQGRHAICGRCKTPLPLAAADAAAQAAPRIVTDATFATEIERSPLPVLLDLWAPWCGPCRTVGPVVEALAQEMAGRVRVAKMNVDDNPATSARFNVRSIPTLLILKDGREVDRIIGAQPKAEIARRLQAQLA